MKHALTLIITLLTLMACSTPDKVGKSSSQTPSHLTQSSVDISYTLGHSHRRFIARGTPQGFTAQTYLDEQVLKESQIDQAHYAAFLDRAALFVGGSGRHPSKQTRDDTCRSPFTVTLRKGEKTQTLEGCRSSDEGALSHLVRAGEFLLYSKK